MRIFICLIGLTTSLMAFGQYPFEKFPCPEYKLLNGWKKYTRSNKTHFTQSIPNYFKNNDTLTLVFSQGLKADDSLFISLYRNSTLVVRFYEPFHFLEESLIFEPTRVFDIDSNYLNDVKIVLPYMGNGLAALNQRIIYLCQLNDGEFKKISFLDKMEIHRPERDFDGDKKYEILTMTLNGYQNHNYWTFNIYNFIDEEFINNNSKFNYPIMIQYLLKPNFTITNKISKELLPSFGATKPEDYYISKN